MASKRNYTTEQMSKALDDVKKGIPAAVAAKKYGVPRSTLRHKKDGKSPLICSMGPSTILSTEEESLLVKWILELSERHFPISKEQLLDTVQKIVSFTERDKTFVNNRPSDKWFRLFLKRHPQISQRMSQNLTLSRENVTEKNIRDWFSEVKHYLESKGLSEIIKEPSRVFNADESAFYLSPKEGRVLAKKGDKNVYRSSGDEKENITVLVTANAAGKLAPPMIVLAYERIPSAISKSMPKDWALGTSDNGWMCSSTFYEYIVNIFNPWLLKENIQKPVIFFVDGHVSHLTMHLSNFCGENGIELVALFPNSTHLLQPMDVAVFRPLKLAYKNEVQKWRMENYGNKLQKFNFGYVFEKSLKHISTETIQNGFKCSGLCPFNVENVHFDKISVKKTSFNINSPISTTSLATSNQSLQALKYFEERLGKEKLNLFKLTLDEGPNWNGPMTDKSLFEIWKEWRLDAQSNSEKSTTMGGDENHVFQVQCTPEKHSQPSTSGTYIPKKQFTAMNDSQPSTPSPGTSSAIQNKLIYTPEPSCSNVQTQSPFKIPTPFKKALFWPDPKPQTKKRKLKEKIPSVVTSEAWREYHQKKENEKKKKLEEKEKRKIAREEKLLLKKKQKKDRSDDDEDEEEWAESGGSSDDVDPFEDPTKEFCQLTHAGISVGDYVLVKFLGGKRNSVTYRYVCIVQELLDNSDVKVMSMKTTSAEKNVFICDENDISFVKKESILGVLPTPLILSTGERIRYEFDSPVDVFEA